MKTIILAFLTLVSIVRAEEYPQGVYNLGQNQSQVGVITVINMATNRGFCRLGVFDAADTNVLHFTTNSVGYVSSYSEPVMLSFVVRNNSTNVFTVNYTFTNNMVIYCTGNLSINF